MYTCDITMVTGSLCLPVYLEGETRQVTLWRKPGGFGVHFSGGLPPIVVTYVEPGVYIQLCGMEPCLAPCYTRATKSISSSLPLTYSLVPRPLPPSVFDCFQCNRTNQKLNR